MKKVFVFAMVCMAMGMGTLCSCSKDSKYEEVNEETQSYWTYEDLAGVWIEATERDNPMAPFVQVTGTTFWSEGFLAEGQIRSGDVCYFFGHKEMVMFKRNGYEGTYKIDWLNDQHTACMWQEHVYMMEQCVPIGRPMMMVKVATVPKGWTE